MTDIEIARGASLKKIKEIANMVDIPSENLVFYGDNKAKIHNFCGKKSGKLILVTATSPTPYGEGKTTVSIGLADALKQLEKSVVAVLREPSMGPVFGMKGGATGGGYSQVVPMEEINLHFTGDFHAITSANNLLCAAIDNHIEKGNQLDIQKVIFKRCLDVNDRELRHVQLKNREDAFTITAASEIMALFCLATSLEDLRKRLGDIVIGYNSEGHFVYARELHIVGSLVVLLKDAFMPNLVQTLENTPVLIHGGPFANIAHGCNSIIATKLGISLADYVVTEAGFGADLGAEKFFDIKCRKANLQPDCVVLVTTLKSLYYNGEGQLSFANLQAHIDNLSLYTNHLVVCINKYEEDRLEDIEKVLDYCAVKNIPCAISTAYVDGGSGAISLAKEVLKLADCDSKFQLLYDLSSSITEKIEKVSREIYHANEVIYTEKAQKTLQLLEKEGVSNLPICVAKTQYSLSDDAKKLGSPHDYSITVRDLVLYNGAGFITVLLGNIMTMPGLPSVPNYEKIDLDLEGNIIGLF